MNKAIVLMRLSNNNHKLVNANESSSVIEFHMAILNDGWGRPHSIAIFRIRPRYKLLVDRVFQTRIYTT